MNSPVDDAMETVRRESEGRLQALHRLLSGADSSKVFGQPVSSGGYTVILAAEVASGGGFGSGIGFGTPRRQAGETESSAEPPDALGREPATASAIVGVGGGGGGGGGAMGRPVAVIVVGPDGVEVKPVFDITKLAITALGAFGAAAAVSLRLLSKK
jgi:uncharacterized spore protein YtfJ